MLSFWEAVVAGTGGLDQTAVFQEGGKAGWAGIDLRAGIRDNRLGGGIDRRRALYAHSGGGEGGGIFALRRWTAPLKLDGL